MLVKEKIKEAIVSTLVISNIESFEKYTWPKIEKIIENAKNTDNRTSTTSS